MVLCFMFALLLNQYSSDQICNTISPSVYLSECSPDPQAANMAETEVSVKVFFCNTRDEGSGCLYLSNGVSCLYKIIKAICKKLPVLVGY